MRNSVLMGTILSRSQFPHKPLRDIIDTLGVGKIFVFEIKDKQQFLLTYNLDKTLIGLRLEALQEKYKNTIRLHRKRKNNVFFTINAINKLEEEEKVNWDLYHDCLLLFSGKEGELSKMDLSLLKIVNIGEKI